KFPNLVKTRSSSKISPTNPSPQLPITTTKSILRESNKSFSKRSQSTGSNQIRQNRKMKSPEINLNEYQNERDDRNLDKERDDNDCSLEPYYQPQPINENDDFNNSKDIETEYDE
ncbi:1824_t:CDS:2, partial [Funneliformis caledonium]